MEFFAKGLRLIFELASIYPLCTLCLIGMMWIVVYVNKRNGNVQRFDVNTSQTRDELMKRSGTALNTQTGEEVKSKRTRGGFQHETESTSVFGWSQKSKKK